MSKTIRGVLIAPPHPTLLIADVRRLKPCREGLIRFVRLCRARGGENAKGLVLDRYNTELLALQCGIHDLAWLAHFFPLSKPDTRYRSDHVRAMIFGEIERAESKTKRYIYWRERSLVAAVTIRAYIREWPEWIEEAARRHG